MGREVNPALDYFGEVLGQKASLGIGTPIPEVIQSLNFGPTALQPSPEQDSPGLLPSGSTDQITVVPRRSVERQSSLQYFPIPPGLRMIWQVTQTSPNPYEVLQQINAEGEPEIVLAIKSSMSEDKPPQFYVKMPDGMQNDFSKAVENITPFILRKIAKPKSVSQQAFDKAITVIQENLAIIAPLLTYSNDGQEDRFIAEENHQPASIALDHIALALSSIASSETQMQRITRALQADLLALY